MQVILVSRPIVLGDKRIAYTYIICDLHNPIAFTLRFANFSAPIWTFAFYNGTFQAFFKSMFGQQKKKKTTYWHLDMDGKRSTSQSQASNSYLGQKVRPHVYQKPATPVEKHAI